MPTPNIVRYMFADTIESSLLVTNSTHQDHKRLLALTFTADLTDMSAMSCAKHLNLWDSSYTGVIEDMLGQYFIRISHIRPVHKVITIYWTQEGWRMMKT